MPKDSKFWRGLSLCNESHYHKNEYECRVGAHEGIASTSII